MTKQTKILLAVSLTSFALSLTGVLWGLFLPVAAIFLGLTLISRLLSKEVALYDEEQRLRRSKAEQKAPASQSTAETHGESSLRAAHAR